jgi:hypothetical protein
MIWPSGQSVGFIESARFVYNEERELGKEQGPACLLSGKFLFGAEVSKVVVVCPDFEREWVAFEVVAERFEGVDNSE